jgi:hypothetical protein
MAEHRLAEHRFAEYVSLNSLHGASDAQTELSIVDALRDLVKVTDTFASGSIEGCQWKRVCHKIGILIVGGESIAQLTNFPKYEIQSFSHRHPREFQ